MSERAKPYPPGTVIDKIEPTDALLNHRARIRGHNLERLHDKANARRDEKTAQTRPTRLGNVFVRPARPDRPVLDRAGHPYPAAGVFVPLTDVYAQRRLRDGSLLRADPPRSSLLLTDP